MVEPTWRWTAAARAVGLAALLAGCSTGDQTTPQPGAGSGGTAGSMQPGNTAGNGGSAGMAGGAGSGGSSAGGGGGSAGTAGSSAMDAAVQQDATVGDAGEDAAVMPAGTAHVYVSGYGPDITHFILDRESGALANQGTVSGGVSPSYLAISPNKRALYAVNESGGADSQVVAFSIDPDSGALAEINSASSGGEGAPHLAVHPTGEYIAVAHYGSGHTSILPVLPNGGVGEAVDVKRGPSDDCRKAHQAVFDASGRHLLVPCLESNYVLQFQFADGVLAYNVPPSVAVAGGPRHLALAPDQQHAYVLSELDSLITSFTYDAATGKLAAPQTIDSQEQTKGASAHLAVHPSGRWLYVSNRAENSLGLFSIDANGRPHPVAFEREGIDTPRDFTIDPAGEYLILANQNGAQNLRVYRIDPDDGGLTHLQTVAVGGNPTFVGIVLLP